MTDRELLEQALELVSKYHARETILAGWEKSVIKDLEARLAEDDDEPFAWVAIPDHHGDDALYFDKQEAIDDGHSFVWPLYRHPQPKARLTDKEIEEIHREFPSRVDLFARAIERKIWEKAE